MYMLLKSIWGNKKLFILMVPRAGLEPARGCPRGILNPLCLPIPPPGQRSDDYIALRQ